MSFSRFTSIFAILAMAFACVVSAKPKSANPNLLVYEASFFFGLPGCQLKVELLGDGSAIYTPSSETTARFTGPWPVEGERLELSSLILVNGKQLTERVDVKFDKNTHEPIGYEFQDMRMKQLSPLAASKLCVGLKRVD
jgi:hypothetical protein